MKNSFRRRLASLGCGLIGLGTVATALAGTATYDFNAAPPADLNFVGNAEWRADGGVNNSGYMALFDAKNSQHATVLIPDFDKGLVVKAFTFEVDLRVGNATGNAGRPADGFSISYAHADDPVVLDLNQEPPVDDQSHFAVSGGPENGCSTGLSICFDTWSGNTLPGGLADIEGIEIIVNDVVQVINGANGIPMATRNGSCTDPTSLQTGPYDAAADAAGTGGDPSGLCWAHLKVDLSADQILTVNWKGTDIVSNYKVAGFSPAPGRIVFAGRTGSANENTHIDNLKITTVPSDKVVIGSPSGTPTGFSQALIDSGSSSFSGNASDVTSYTLDGTAITPNSISKSGVTSTILYDNPNAPFVSGSTHTVVISLKDALGATISGTNTFTAPSFITLDPATAAANVDKTKPGFALNVYQVDYTDNGTAHGSELGGGAGVTLAAMERALHGDIGANTADLTLYTGPNKTYTETKVINYNAATTGGNIGGFVDDGTGPASFIPSTGPASGIGNLPGLPGISGGRENGIDDVTLQIVTYIEFPAAGAYRMDFNSDDGFRVTTSANPLEQLTSQIAFQDDVGKGASDIWGWVYVGTPGVYPFRAIWANGGGGCNLEWSAISPGGTNTLINSGDTGALKAYAVNKGAVPAAVTYADPPRGSGRQVPAGYPVTFEITDGATAVSGITLSINGSFVTPTVTKSGSVSKVVYQGLLPQNQTVTAVLGFSDGAKTYSGTNSFSVGGGATVPASMALKASDVDTSKKGFLIKTWQIAVTNTAGPAYIEPGNSTWIGEAYVHQWFGWPNMADLTSFTGPGGSFVETGVINYNGNDNTAQANAGSFNDDGTYGGTAPDMPGISGNPKNPNLPSNGVNDYALEIRTVLDLQPGTYNMGVNSDDGFRLIVGDGKESGTLPVVLGEFNGGRGADNWGFTKFSVNITAAGLYPFRLLFEEGGGGNNVEWFVEKSFWLPDNQGKVLVNDILSNPNGAIKAYQYPVNSTGPTYVKSFSPGRSSSDQLGSKGRAASDATVSAVLVDGSTPVDTAAIALKINGAAVTPTASKASGVTTVTYKPAGGFAVGTTNDVALTFGDRTVNWSFIVGNFVASTPTFWIEAADFDYNGGQTKPEASVMPYAGGAYAGLSATAGTDYDGPNEGDNSYYRYPNTLKVPVSIADDFDRGGGEVAVSYRLGWMGGNHWFNYTRTIPAGKYNVYAALSSGTDKDHIYGNLATVSGGTATVVGAFSATFAATGGGTWGNNNLVPLRDAAATNNVAVWTSDGTPKTFRYTDGSGDWDFMLFAPAAVASPTITSIKANTDGSITITWDGGGTAQWTADLSAPNWQDLTGVTSPATISKANLPGPTAFVRIKQ